MPTVNKSRYRIINFIGERIFQTREANLAQSIAQGYDATGAVSSYEDSALYRQGALLNTAINVTSSNLTFAPIDNTQPMQIFIRDRWEQFLTGEAAAQTLTGTSPIVYVNWQLARITLSQDSDLQDLTTGEPTAEMGQLILTIGADTSGDALTADQLGKNTSPIVLCSFTQSGSTYTLNPFDNVMPAAKANKSTSGLVKLTTNTSSGTALSSDDVAVTNSRPASVASVVDASVRQQATTGVTNPDGTPQYLIGADPGGISAFKIVLQLTGQSLQDAWTVMMAKLSSVVNGFNAHATAVLGLSNTHPIPTASQVGAAPLSHVGQPLGLSTSHPAEVDANAGGFSVHRTPGSDNSGAPAFAVIEGSTVIASLQHNGDIFSNAANAVNASPSSGYSGPLGFMSILATAVAQHINQVSHANPHGLTLGDLGGLSSSSFPSSLGQNGWYQLPGGLIIQWGVGNADPQGQEVTQTIFFPRTFPNSCFVAYVTPKIPQAAGGVDGWYQTISWNNSFMVVQNQQAGGGSEDFPLTPLFFAIGN